MGELSGLERREKCKRIPVSPQRIGMDTQGNASKDCVLARGEAGGFYPVGPVSFRFGRSGQFRSGLERRRKDQLPNRTSFRGLCGEAGGKAPAGTIWGQLEPVRDQFSGTNGLTRVSVVKVL